MGLFSPNLSGACLLAELCNPAGEAACILRIVSLRKRSALLATDFRDIDAAHHCNDFLPYRNLIKDLLVCNQVQDLGTGLDLDDRHLGAAHQERRLLINLRRQTCLFERQLFLVDDQNRDRLLGCIYLCLCFIILFLNLFSVKIKSNKRGDQNA